MEVPYTQGGDNVFGRANPPPQVSGLLPSSGETYTVTPEKDDDLAWLVAKHKDVDATNKLYERHVDDVYRFFLGRTANVSEAEDLTEETFIRAIKGLQGGTWPGQPFQAWLFGIAKNVYFEWKRAIKRRSALMQRSRSHGMGQREHIEEAELLGQILAREQRDILWGLVGELPELDRQVLILRFVYDLSHEEVAEKVGVTPHACKTRQHRALQKLREKVLKAGLQEEFGIGKS